MWFQESPSYTRGQKNSKFYNWSIFGKKPGHLKYVNRSNGIFCYLDFLCLSCPPPSIIIVASLNTNLWITKNEKNRNGCPKTLIDKKNINIVVFAVLDQHVSNINKTPGYHRDILRPPVLLEELLEKLHQSFNISNFEYFLYFRKILRKLEKDI